MTDHTPLKLNAADFKDRLKKLIPFMSTDETRYYLCGVHLAFTSPKLKLTATNGHILCEMLVDVPETSPEEAEFALIIPAVAVKHLVKIIKGKAEDYFLLTVREGGKEVVFDFFDFTYVTRTVDFQYPDTARVIPEGKLRMREGLNAGYLLAALNALGNKAVDISVDDAEKAAEMPHLLTSSESEGIRCVVMPMRI